MAKNTKILKAVNEIIEILKKHDLTAPEIYGILGMIRVETDRQILNLRG